LAPLHIPASVGNPVILVLLLEAFADSMTRDNRDRTPLHFTSLHFAGHKNHFLSARLLCEDDADVNAFDRSGFTPLHCASEVGANETIKLFF
jgi:ankyrin repeat protein